MSQERARRLAGVGIVATGVFGAIAVASATRASAHIDRKLAPRLALKPRSRRRRVADRLSPMAKWYVLAPVTMVAGAVVVRATQRPSAGITIAASPIVAAILGELFDRTLPQPPVPANHRHEQRKPVFPSGHGLLATATALTAAYVIDREGLANRVTTLSAAIVFAVANPALKLAVRKHWLSDAIGGIAAGVGTAAFCCAGYELARD